MLQVVKDGENSYNSVADDGNIFKKCGGNTWIIR